MSSRRWRLVRLRQPRREYAGAPCCRYRSSTNLLGVGRHRIEVRSRDALGIDPTPAAYEWTVQPAKPKVVSGSCSYRIPWYSFSEFPLYRCTPIDSTVCPLSSRCTLETQALHSDDDPLNEERFEESPYASASGYFAAVSQGQIWKNDPGRVDVYRRCNAGKAAGNSVAGYTHRCTVANTYERVTVADAFEMRNECQGSRFGVFGTRPIIDRGPDGHRILQCTSKFTVEAVPSALGDALDSVTRAGAPILSVVAPSRGTMQASATFGGIGAITAAATQPGSRVAAQPTTVQVDAAGVVKLRLELTKAALRKPRRPRGVRIVVTYEFTPDEGPGPDPLAGNHAWRKPMIKTVANCTIAAAAVVFGASPAHAQLPAGNLIQNPGAEVGEASPRHLGVPPPQWDVTGNVSQVLYDSSAITAPTGFPRPPSARRSAAPTPSSPAGRRQPTNRSPR